LNVELAAIAALQSGLEASYLIISRTLIVKNPCFSKAGFFNALKFMERQECRSNLSSSIRSSYFHNSYFRSKKSMERS
jgi:hypothetical protein